MRVSTLRKEFLIKDNMYRTENDIFLCITYKAISIFLILNEYHQFRIQYKFTSTNLIWNVHIYFTTKDMEIQ